MGKKSFRNNVKLGRAFVSIRHSLETKKKKKYYMGARVEEPFITKDYFL